MVVDCKVSMDKGSYLYMSVNRHRLRVCNVKYDRVCRWKPPAMILELRIYFEIVGHCTGHIPYFVA